MTHHCFAMAKMLGGAGGGQKTASRLENPDHIYFCEGYHQCSVCSKPGCVECLIQCQICFAAWCPAHEIDEPHTCKFV